MQYFIDGCCSDELISADVIYHLSPIYYYCLEVILVQTIIDNKQDSSETDGIYSLHVKVETKTNSSRAPAISHVELSCRSLQFLSILLVRGDHCVGNSSTSRLFLTYVIIKVMSFEV